MDKASRIDAWPSLRPLRPRILWTVIKAAGLVPMTAVFCSLYCIAIFVVAATEPGVEHLGDAAWFLYTVITTVGLGDYTCVTVLGRVATVLLSLYSVFYLALITGAVVSYCSERMMALRNESVAAFVDKLRRLPELSQEELVEISEYVKRL